MLVDHQVPREMVNLVGGAKKILIDEVNFFDPEEFVKIVKELLAAGADVYAAGLSLDSERVDWEPMASLVKQADRQVELTARCDGEGGRCSEPAVYSYRKKANRERVEVAGVEKYGAACTKHYGELHQRG